MIPYYVQFVEFNDVWNCTIDINPINSQQYSAVKNRPPNASQHFMLTLSMHAYSNSSPILQFAQQRISVIRWITVIWKASSLFRTVGGKILPTRNGAALGVFVDALCFSCENVIHEKNSSIAFMVEFPKLTLVSNLDRWNLSRQFATTTKFRNHNQPLISCKNKLQTHRKKKHKNK